MKKAVLLVDDQPQFRIRYQGLLEDLDYEITVASSGEEALRKFRDENFHVVITDYHMGTMDGIELARKIKEINPEMPVVLLTTDPPPDKPVWIDRVIIKANSFNEFSRLSELIRS